MSDRETLVVDLLRDVLADIAQGHEPETIVSERFDTGPLLCNDDPPTFYAAVANILLEHPRIAEPLADAFVDLADELVTSIAEDRQVRIECALSFYAAAAEIYPKEKKPADWAHVASRVAVAFTHRTAGDRVENIATAQKTARTALEVAAATGDAVLQAQTYSVLGSALLEGDDPAQFDLARKAFETSGQLYKSAGDLEGWADAILDACIAITESTLPVRPDDLIAAAEQCAEVMTHASDLPSYIHANAALVAAKVALERGEYGATEHAILILETALDGLGPGVHLATEAKMHVNLGVAYGTRLLGDPEENLERALQAFLTARSLFGPSFPIDAALVDLNLAAVYRDRVLGNPVENYAAAVEAARRAQTAYLAGGYRSLWATASSTLGQLLVEEHTFADDLFWEGIEHLQAAETYLRENGRDVEHAGIGVMLGVVWTSAPNPVFAHGLSLLEKAAATYDRLGEFYRWGYATLHIGRALGTAPSPHPPPYPEAAQHRLFEVLERLPLDLYADIRLQAAQILAQIAENEGNVARALDAHRHAADAAEILAAVGFDDPRRAHDLAERAWPFFGDLIRSAVAADDPRAAMFAAKRARSLALHAAFVTDPALASLPASLQEAILVLRTQALELRHRIFGQASLSGFNIRAATRPAKGRLLPPARPEPLAIADQWVELEREAAALQRQVDDLTPAVQVLPAKPPSRLSSEPPARPIQKRSPDAAVLDLFVGPDGIWMGWTAPDGSVEQRWAGAEARNALLDLVRTTSRSGGDDWTRLAWALRLPGRLARLSRALDLDAFVQHIPPSCRTLAIIPHRETYGVPFSALPIQDGVLADRFDEGIVLYPLPMNERIYAINQLGRSAKEDAKSLDVVALIPEEHAPTLAGAELWLGGVAYTLANPEDIAQYASTCDVLHIAAHGRLLDTDPLAAAIDLGGGITFGPVSAYGLDLSRCQLVVLAACDSAVADSERAGESYLGMQSVFLMARARAVLAAHWTVSDVAAAILLGRTYLEIQSNPTSQPEAALAYASRWARRARKPEIVSWLQARQLASDMKRHLISELDALPTDQPLADPSHWASFSVYARNVWV